MHHHISYKYNKPNKLLKDNIYVYMSPISNKIDLCVKTELD
jgi:hypothetical protein